MAKYKKTYYGIIDNKTGEFKVAPYWYRRIKEFATNFAIDIARTKERNYIKRELKERDKDTKRRNKIEHYLSKLYYIQAKADFKKQKYRRNYYSNKNKKYKKPFWNLILS